MKYPKLTNPSNVPQSKPISPAQVPNNAGGFVFSIDKWARLDRFLILGSEHPTYYQNAQALTWENARCVTECLEENVARTMKRIVDISRSGRAPKNDPAIFALILGVTHSNEVVRRVSATAVREVCRTATHLFQFITGARDMRKGWGTIMKRAVSRWYDNRPVDKLAYQTIKYRTRNGFDHKRALRCAHPIGNDDQEPERTALYRWIVGKDYDHEKLPAIVKAHLEAMALEPSTLNWPDMFQLVRDHKLPWEALPTWALTEPGVWQTMLPDMGITALIRNLGNMTANGALVAAGGYVSHAVNRLCDEAQIAKSRVHPFQVLTALETYRSGHGLRGGASWTPITQIIDALDQAFYLAFQNVAPTGKRILLALDVSSSMNHPLMGSPVTACQGSAAMALVTLAAEQNVEVVGFTAGGRGWRSTNISPLTISPRQRLDDVTAYIQGINFGGTDCALPMLWADKHSREFDAFVIYTDSETWAGGVHPSQALKDYRRTSGIDAKLVVVGMTSTGFSIADPDDAGMLDVVGFDASCPALISDFIEGGKNATEAG